MKNKNNNIINFSLKKYFVLALCQYSKQACQEGGGKANVFN